MKNLRKHLITMAAVALFVSGAGIALYPMATDLRYEFEQWRFTNVAEAAELPAGGIALPAGTVARIEIPAIGVDAYVVEGTGGDALAKGPGHYPDTPLPGQPGNACIAGHRTTHGHTFHDLHLLREGFEIVTYTAERRATYRVVSVTTVDPSQTEVADPTDDSRLTLTTCHPIGSARQRLVVVAELTD